MSDSENHFKCLNAFKGRRRNNIIFSVRPRYSPGSPAQVNEGIARRVAVDEVADYERALSGVYGEAHKNKAKSEGLSDIVVAMIEVRKGWDVLDLITGERYTRPFNS